MPVLPKKRYLLAEIHGGIFDSKSVKHLVHDAVQEFLGELGAAKARVTVKIFDSSTQTVVLQCQLDFLNESIAALAFKRRYNDKDVKISLKKISGTIKSLTN